jgi:hypothetical protein
LIRISGFPSYISIRPMILTCFPSTYRGLRRRRNPAGERLVGVRGADIEESVSARGSEDLCHYSLNGGVLANVRRGFVGGNDGGGLGSLISANSKSGATRIRTSRRAIAFIQVRIQYRADTFQNTVSRASSVRSLALTSLAFFGIPNRSGFVIVSQNNFTSDTAENSQ